MQFDPSLLNALSGQSAVIDADGTVISINSAWRQYALENGYEDTNSSPNYGVGRNYLSICDTTEGKEQGDADRVATGIRSVIDGTSNEFSHEYPCHTPTEQRWYKCVVRAVKNAQDTADAFLVQHIDVTEQVAARISAEADWTREQVKLNELIETVPVRVAKLDKDLIYRFANQQFAEGLGLPKHEIIGKPAIDVLGERAWNRLSPYVSRAFLGETVRFEADMPLPRSERLQVVVTYMPDRNSGGEIDGIFAFIQDISELKQRENSLYIMMRAAEDANQAKSQFLASMSHELRTPLNAIIGFSEIITLQLAGSSEIEKHKEYAGDILLSARHLLSMVDDILDLSAIEDGKVTIDKKPMDLNAVVAECQRSIAKQYKQKNQTFTINNPQSPPDLAADKRAIKQVILNVLSNAVKYTPENGHISLDVLEQEKNVMIRITDTGIGIAEERLDRVTDAFSRAGHEAYVAEKGWGLGLSISKALVELHDGVFRIDSRLGEGTTVTITLPNGHEPTAPPLLN